MDNVRQTLVPEIDRQRKAYERIQRIRNLYDKQMYNKLKSLPASDFSEMKDTHICEYMFSLARLCDWYGDYECTLAAWHHALHLSIDDNLNILRKDPEFKGMTNPQRDDILSQRYPILAEWHAEMMKVEIQLFKLGVMPANRNSKSARIKELINVLKKRHEALVSNGSQAKK